jgi:hypothetical protein
VTSTSPLSALPAPFLRADDGPVRQETAALDLLQDVVEVDFAGVAGEDAAVGTDKDAGRLGDHLERAAAAGVLVVDGSHRREVVAFAEIEGEGGSVV